MIEIQKPYETIDNFMKFEFDGPQEEKIKDPDSENYLKILKGIIDNVEYNDIKERMDKENLLRQKLKEK